MQPELNAHQLFVDMAYERGLIVYSRRTRGGLSGDHILVCPPLIITREQVDELMAILADTLVAFAREARLDVQDQQGT